MSAGLGRRFGILRFYVLVLKTIRKIRNVIGTCISTHYWAVCLLPMEITVKDNNRNGDPRIKLAKIPNSIYFIP
jgi:hypothetical protein